MLHQVVNELYSRSIMEYSALELYYASSKSKLCISSTCGVVHIERLLCNLKSKLFEKSKLILKKGSDFIFQRSAAALYIEDLYSTPYKVRGYFMASCPYKKHYA